MRRILALASLLVIANTEAALIRSKSSDDVTALVNTLNDHLGGSYDERTECSRMRRVADDLARKGQHEESYRLLKQSICGSGQSEYSKIYTKLVDERIEAFCSQEHIDMDTLSKFQKSFDLVLQYRIWYQSPGMECRLHDIAATEKNREKLIRLHKETIFWSSVRLIVDSDIEELHWFRINKIEELGKLTSHASDR
jgi:hypothetical protein